MALLGETTGNLRTYPVATKVKGMLIQGVPVVSTATGVWRPMSGTDLQKLPEKVRLSAQYKLLSETAHDWTNVKLEFEFDSDWWEIMHEKNNSTHSFLQHYVYFLKRIENV